MIKLIRSYPYDNNYDYTKLFTTKEAQEQYFNTFYSIIDNEYNDENEQGYIKDNESFCVNYNYDYLVSLGVNYIIFNNGYKDIYAFIVKKEYINDDITKLHYEVDVLQTFLFDFSLGKSFVERKMCGIEEITDFDEGLYLGEHIIELEHQVFTKNYTWFAMFNGFKEQQIVFDENNKIKDIVDIPVSMSAPTTTIDEIQYPLYFMPLLEDYDGAVTSGTVKNGVPSKNLFRFLKGYEQFSSVPYDDGFGYMTIGYGITADFRPSEYALLYPSCTEKEASEVMSDILINDYALAVYNFMLTNGCNVNDIKQQHFDAFCSLAYNCGVGGATSSPMMNRYLINPNDPTILTDWSTYFTNGGNEGLLNRRNAEIDIYSVNQFEMKPIGGVSGDGYIPPIYE